MSTLDAAIRGSGDEVHDRYFNDKITKDLKILKEHALKIGGKHCVYFTPVN